MMTTTPEPVLHRHPIRGAIWGLIMGLGVILLLMVLRIVPVTIPVAIIYAVVGGVVGVLWGVFGPPKRPKGLAPRPYPASLDPQVTAPLYEELYPEKSSPPAAPPDETVPPTEMSEAESEPDEESGD